MRYGLLGRKLAHSYSPFIHKALGAGYSYELFEVEPEGLSEFLRREDVKGFNVTIPYKKDVIPSCRELSPAAAAIGSVNTVFRRDGGLYGDNTDAYGFSTMVKESGIGVRGKKVVIIGGGASSLTVCYVLKKLDAGEVIVITRTENNHMNLSRHADARVIVNTTPVGMYPDTGVSPVDLSYFPKLEGVLDLVYNPIRTRLLMDAKNKGIKSMGGLTMLVSQARAACELFSGQVIDAAMEKRVTKLLRKQMENITLIGMPGCGKTTIGKALAESMGREFSDADAVIEKRGLSIPEIFRLEGEEGFRRRETEILAELGKRSGLIIATGGGCVTRQENYDHLRQNGAIAFLERDIGMLERKGRPLSQGADLEAMYLKRLPMYRNFADFAVLNDASADMAAEKIKEAFYAAIDC